MKSGAPIVLILDQERQVGVQEREESLEHLLRSAWCLEESEKVVFVGHVRLCDPVGCGLPGSYVYEILQASVLEWVAIPFSREYSQPIAGRVFRQSLPHCRQSFYHLSHKEFQIWMPIF